MYISSDSGSWFCTSFENFKEQLQSCFAEKFENELWCAVREGGYPCLAILVNEQQAVVNYFAEENGNLAVSLGIEGVEESVTFCGGRYEVAGYQVIPAADAFNCALAFFRSQELPDCIHWEEL